MVMERSIRTFKLRVSNEGFDLLARCHHRLMTATRTLIPYGATLTVAMEWLDRERPRPPLAIERTKISGLCGPITLFVGAPRWISSKALEFSNLLEKPEVWGARVSIGEVYLLALYGLSRISSADLVVLASQITDEQDGGVKKPNVELGASE